MHNNNNSYHVSAARVDSADCCVVCVVVSNKGGQFGRLGRRRGPIRAPSTVRLVDWNMSCNHNHDYDYYRAHVYSGVGLHSFGSGPS